MEEHIAGECGCKDCNKVYDIFAAMRSEYLTEKYGQEWPKGAELTEVEKQNILAFAKYMVEQR